MQSYLNKSKKHQRDCSPQVAAFGNFPTGTLLAHQKNANSSKEKQFMEIKCFCQIFLWTIHLDEIPPTRQDSIINLTAVQPTPNCLPGATAPRQPHDADCGGPKDASFLE